MLKGTETNENCVLSLPSTYDENELLSRVAQGDEHAFTVLFNHWYPLLSTLILRVTRSELLAQEVVQEVFLKVWMGREALAYVKNFKPYLWVMARHLAIDALRKTAARTQREKMYANEHPLITDPEDTSMYKTLLDEAISKLPPRQQQVYLLSRRDRLKQQEIAGLMGISISTVKSYLQLSVESITAYIRARAGLGTAVTAILIAFH